MNFKYRSYSQNDSLMVTPSLYNAEPNKIFSPTEQNTITILQNNKIVAFMDLSYYYESGVHTIDLFEVFDTGNGLGTQIINEVKQCEEVSCIEINPYSKRSVNFWIKMGFKFIDDETMQWKKGQANEIT